ncbi:vaculolar membrane protein (macronuclear) [Tetrahymena thermophila SB210]|uniref:Vaculolar membrane protein n=1 Tax=Tetrahymena thermophila (strain SB210) TaxID=312017 RepID=Q23H86_TETTS|nr:vaculolar membrane protein [Tetrahymena thermophila SB210]EAR95922.2 vaculolar membrane protein [Tetrahymena thermophila SB210]|eukprot:XP_001016167.2 vaculolar membrane protein [Tetrahymena thermophila SB210]
MGEGCEITDLQGYLVQVSLAVICFLILIYKRHKERPKRLWKIWTLDNSKQGVSALVAHMLNVLLAVTLSGESDLDACNWYFVTVLFDTTLGVFICFIILSIFEKLFDRYHLVKFKTGNYFKVIIPDNGSGQKTKKKSREDESNIHLLKPIVKISYCVWLSQLIIWNLIVVISKFFLYGLQSGISPYLQPIISWMFSFLESFVKLKLIIVMVIVPAILNAIQFWIQDNFLKKNDFNSMEKEYVACQIYENEESQDDTIRRTQNDLQMAPTQTKPSSSSPGQFNYEQKE